MPKTAQPKHPQQLSKPSNTTDFAKKIITSKAHYVEVLASPGSGKTHTLIARLSHLLAAGVPPAQILVLSFSNEAVRELRRRMDFASTTPDATAASDSAANSLLQVTVSTAHAFALSLIPKPPAIITDITQRKLLAQSITLVRRGLGNREIWKTISTAQRQRRREQLDAFKESPARVVPQLLALFDYQRAAGMTLRAALAEPAFTDIGSHSVVRAILHEYRELKRTNAYQDFADLLDAAEARLANGHIKLAIRHVFVDEFQDCSTAQTRLLALVARKLQTKVMVFGDPAQSLYGFAGAHYRSLADFLPNVQQYQLPVSHRLTAQTAALASAVLQLEPAQAIQTVRMGKKPVLVTSPNLTAQTHQVVADIQRLVKNGAKPADIVVLARNKATLHTVESALLAANIDCNRIGLVRTHQHAVNVLRLVNWAARHHQRGIPIEPIKLLSLGCKALPIEQTAAVQQAKKLMRARWPSSLEGQYQLCVQAYLRLLGGIRAHPEVRAMVNRWEPICRQYTDAKAMREALRSQQHLDSGSLTITTGTIHAAKGREWSHVLIVGVTEGVLPDYRATDDSSLMQERNLLYVAITRAKDTVRLYHASTPHAKTRLTFSKLNRHLRGNAVRKLLTTPALKLKTVTMASEANTSNEATKAR